MGQKQPLNSLAVERLVSAMSSPSKFLGEVLSQSIRKRVHFVFADSRCVIDTHIVENVCPNVLRWKCCHTGYDMKVNMWVPGVLGKLHHVCFVTPGFDFQTEGYAS
jgi:hypothetical protein